MNRITLAIAATAALVGPVMALGMSTAGRTERAGPVEFGLSVFGAESCRGVTVSPHATRETMAAAMSDAAAIMERTGCVHWGYSDRLSPDEHRADL